MKRILASMISMTALCLHSHSDTLEEVRQFILETVEEAVQPNTLEHRERWKLMTPRLKAIEGEIRMSVYCEIMAEKFDDPNPEYVSYVISRFNFLDGKNLASSGNQEALDWTRRARREKKQGSSDYLAIKGDARDLDIVGIRNREILAERVAGTNALRLTEHPTSLVVYPSVTNTGPQGVYVNEIMQRAWKDIMVNLPRENWHESVSMIPPELLTMVVRFDDDGNPVCNVDLSKYGLTMPELDVPNRPKPKEKIEATVFPPIREESSDGIPTVESPDGFQPPGQTGSTTPWKLPLLIGVFIFTGVAIVWRYVTKKSA